ncbi:basic amino acid/polyamine antiporter [Lactovum miscens]|uniref:Arginine:ornithine antiporter/lysine permease n=1 Tax=Lactovum miscens TaxID=190387 RepID=A0A841C221_9LACT|nr:basic amino acid/polyamine antiporter [Lactovum miscens]MBB5887976.1 arginine:ornithine antiporter/lysine permease [Lactovum miscens]
MEANKKGIGLVALVALIVSGAIGGGVFNLPNSLASGATAGGALVSWLIVGLGILFLVLTFNYLIVNKPELSGVSDYARAGFGDLVGFISGWGYWLSAWLGNIAFAVLLMTSVDFFFKGTFANKNGSLTILSVVVVSLVMWGLTILVSRGVEGAAVINAIVLIAKLIPLLIFAIAAIVSFRAGVFTEHFWQNVSVNADMSKFTFSAMTGSGFMSQFSSSLMVMIWVFVGIEGAAMMGDRAKKKSDAGRATILGLISLIVIYVLLSILPYGFMDQKTLANVAAPGLINILNAMVGGWGGSLMAIGLIISLLGAWLSWTMLPVEATTQLAKQKLLPKWFGKLNKNNAPFNALMLTGLLMQVFIIMTYFSANAYNVFVYLCTAVIMICYTLVGFYMMKLGFQEKKTSNIIIGFLAGIFQVYALYLSGWIFIWAATIIYIIGFAFFTIAKTENGQKVGKGNIIASAIITLLAIFADIDLLASWGGNLDIRGNLGIDPSSMVMVYLLTAILVMGIGALIYSIIKNNAVKKVELKDA